MHITILIPHWRTGTMTAYSIAQLLKFKGGHHIDIIVVDNNAGDGSTEYLEPFMKDITIVNYPKDILQSHGCAFDYVLPFVKTRYFFTMESDSFPTKDNWLDEYQHYTDKDVDAAGSLLKLSGGTYLHPCGAMYKKSVWQEAMEYAKTIPYFYYPNMSMSTGFACHLMVHKTIANEVLAEPEDYIELADGYKPYSPALAEEKRQYYSPVCGVFHNGMGGANETVRSYGQRTVESEIKNVILDGKLKLVNRIGAEPGQWFSWYLAAMNKKIFYIPTETKWVNGKEGHQQEYTLNEAGFRHLWGISAYKDVDPNDEIAKIKQALPMELYNSLPEYQKIEK